MEIRLSESQKQAVDHQDGALLVIAGPGSGKTRVLTERVKRLLTESKGHFHVLALTFTNKAANEMKERLVDVKGISDRAFIGTIHSFCTEVLVQRGRSVGIEGMPQIIDSTTDRRAILADAINTDPDLLHELKLAGDIDAQKKKISSWMEKIVLYKSLLLMPSEVPDEIDRTIYEAYQAALRASDSVDFDDLLLLTYNLLTERPKVADFYRRLYAYICVDEGQDLNHAQFRIICALAGDDFKNIMIVGDPKQSIYGFNTADPKYLDEFKERFGARVIELRENFRSAARVVEVARALKPNYAVKGILAVQGEVHLNITEDESEEANRIIETIDQLIASGHPDVEGSITLERCAVLGRTRYTLLEVEKQLKSKQWRYYKQWSAKHENVSGLTAEFECCLRILANPKNQVHRKQLTERWKCVPHTPGLKEVSSGLDLLQSLGRYAESPTTEVCLNAISAMEVERDKLLLDKAIDVMRLYADSQSNEDKRAIYEDTTVLGNEWDRYLRSKVGGYQDLKAFLAHVALGTTQQMRQEGLALITIHSAKGLEFDVVFVVGMAEKTFPDYRAMNSPSALEEEKRSAFVAVSRSKRLLFLSYPRLKRMPWGDVWPQQPSRFLQDMELL